MIRLRHKLMLHSFRFTDQLSLIGSLFITAGILLPKNQVIPIETSGLFSFALLSMGWIGIFEHFVRYNHHRLETLESEISKLVKANSGASIWLLVVLNLFTNQNTNLEFSFSFLATTCLIAGSTRIITRKFLATTLRSRNNLRYLLIVGPESRAHQLANRIESKPELGYKISGIISNSENPASNHSWQENNIQDSIRHRIKKNRVDEILSCFSIESHIKEIVEVIKEAKNLGIVVRLFPNPFESSILSGAKMEEFDNDCVVTIFREHHVFQLLAKRLLDISVSALLLFLLSPFLLVVGIFVRVTSPGPALFTQVRVGMNQRKFRLLKFRSMFVGAEQRRTSLEHLNERDGPVFKIANDPRITAFGRWIRKTSIDELPQLYNVLIGDMSLVGPRPPLPDEVKCYEWIYRKRLSVKPGITCIWQVSGRNIVSFDRWMQMDQDYVDHWSIWLDLKLLIKTIPAVLLSRGAS